MNHQRAGHPRLHHEAAGARRDDCMFGPPGDSVDLGALQARDEAAASDAAEHIVMGERGPQDAPPREAGLQVAHDRFDFGQLGHAGKK
jgi:hypothetical protein